MAAYHVDDTEYLTDLDLNKTFLGGCIMEVLESPDLKITDTCSVDDSFFSELLRCQRLLSQAGSDKPNGSMDSIRYVCVARV